MEMGREFPTYVDWHPWHDEQLVAHRVGVVDLKLGDSRLDRRVEQVEELDQLE